MLILNAEPLPALVGHALPERVGVAALVLFHLTDELLGAFLLEEIPGEVLEHFLFFGKAEVHDALLEWIS